MQRLEQLQQMREAADGQDGEQEKARVQHDALKRSVANASAAWSAPTRPIVLEDQQSVHQELCARARKPAARLPVVKTAEP